MKSLYREEVEPSINLLNNGIEERLSITNGEEDETIMLLKYIISKISKHRGDYIKIPPITPEMLHNVDTEFIYELLTPSKKDHNFHSGVVYNALNITLDDLIMMEESNDI